MKPRCASWAAVALVLASCGAGEAPTAAAGPSLPPLMLSSRLAALEELGSTAPGVPDERTRSELSELVAAAFSSIASPDMQAEAGRWLLAHDEVFAGLEEGLRHPEAAVRASCAFQLGERGERAAVPTLLWRVRQEFDPAALAWIVAALDRLGNRASLPRLAELLRDEARCESALPATDAILLRADAWPEERSWEALATAVEALHVSWRSARRGTFEREAGDERLHARLAALLAGLDGFQLKPVDEARTAFTQLTTLPLDLLSLGVTAQERYLRVHTVEIARDLGPLAAPLGPELLALLGDPVTRLYAVEALGEVGHAEALPFLLVFLSGDDLELRVAAAMALGPLGQESAVEPLRAIVQAATENPDVRVRAAFSLEHLTRDGTGADLLRDLVLRETYHAPTLRELLARLEPGT